MREGLTFFVENASLIINAMAAVVVAFGTIEVFLRSLHDVFRPSAGSYLLRDRYLRYVRWLVAGLTFQLAADIIGTTTGMSWDEIGRLAAIAAIRTFLSYFLDRDMAEVRKLQEKTDAKLGARQHSD
jgi:uncharacterized membrane protein